MTQHTLRVLTKRTQEQMKGLHTGILPLLTDIRSSFILQLAILKWLETRCTSVAYQGFFEVSIYQLYTVILTQESTDLFNSKIWCIASMKFTLVPLHIRSVHQSHNQPCQCKLRSMPVLLHIPSCFFIFFLNACYGSLTGIICCAYFSGLLQPVEQGFSSNYLYTNKNQEI